MKNKIILTLLPVLMSAYLTAQNCEAYIPAKTGIVQTYVTKDKKDKITGYYSHEILSVENTDGKIVYTISQSNFDSKKELISKDTLEFYCENNSFYVDMNAFLNKEQMAAYDETQITFTSENIDYPGKMVPGTTLKDGYIQADINAGITITFRTDIINRKVLAFEDITTEAGKFNAVKISQEIVGKYGFVKVNMSTLTWMKLDIGNIRTETYDKNGNLFSTTELISIKQ